MAQAHCADAAIQTTSANIVAVFANRPDIALTIGLIGETVNCVGFDQTVFSNSRGGPFFRPVIPDRGPYLGDRT
jgi:hypothetical protein